MKRKLLFCMALLLLTASSARAALSYGAAYYQRRLLYAQTGGSHDPIYLFMNEVETEIEATGLEGGLSLTFSENAGVISNENNNRFEFTENSDTFGWIMGSNVIELASCSTGVDTIDFNDVDTLNDLQNLVGENAQDISFALNNRIEISENSESFFLLFDTADTLKLGTDATSQLYTIDFNDVDRLQSIELLIFDGVSSVAATEGTVYYDSDDKNLYVRDNVGWVDLTASVSGVTNLDEAYDAGGAGTGRTITADSGAMVLNNTDADAAFLLSVTPTPSSSAATGGVQITSGANATEDSLQIANSGSGYSISTDSDAFTVDSGGTITAVDAILTGTSGLVLANEEQITNATNTEIRLYDAGNNEDLIFDMDAGTNIVGLKSGTGVIGLALGDVDAVSGVGTIAFDAAAASMTTATTGDAQDLTVGISGATNSSLILSSSGTAADALQITTSAGGMDLTNGGAAGGEDMDLSSTTASVNISAGEDVEDAIVLNASQGGINITADGAAAKDLDLVCTNGSLNLTSGEAIANSMVLSSTGGIDITSASTYDIDVTATGGKFLLVATENAANSIQLQENGGASGGINIFANQGTGASATTEHDASIQLQSDDGGIGLYTTGNVANAIRIEANGGGSETIAVQAKQGTGEAAIAIQAEAGGIDMDAATGKNIDIQGGQITLTSNEAAASAISMTTNTGAAETIVVTNSQGTDEAAIDIDATAGGIDIDAATGKNIDIQGGQILITSNEAVASAIALTANTGAAETILITNSQGTDEAAVNIDATAGGIDIDAATGKNIDIQGGQILLTSNEAAANAISLTTNTGAAETIVVTNSQGTGTGAITLTATAGGVDLTAQAASAAGRFTINSLICLGAAHTFGAADTTPDISGSSYWETGGAVTITDFDGSTFVEGMIIIIKSKHNVTFDVTGNAEMEGGTADIVTADGDITAWIYDDTDDWRLLFFMDMSDDLS